MENYYTLQKFLYIALGAVIMALGIIIGQFVTQDIEAQANGVFDKIQCREPVVVNEHGGYAIELIERRVKMEDKDSKLYHVKKIESKIFGPSTEERIEDYLEMERQRGYYFEFMAVGESTQTSYYIVTKHIDPESREEA